MIQDNSYVIELVLLGLILIFAGMALAVSWINHATKGIFRNRK